MAQRKIYPNHTFYTPKGRETLLLVGYGVCSRSLDWTGTGSQAGGEAALAATFWSAKFQLEEAKTGRGSLSARGVGQQENIRQGQFSSSPLTRLLTRGSPWCWNKFFLPSLPTFPSSSFSTFFPTLLSHILSLKPIQRLSKSAWIQILHHILLVSCLFEIIASMDSRACALLLFFFFVSYRSVSAASSSSLA